MPLDRGRNRTIGSPNGTYILLNKWGAAIRQIHRVAAALTNGRGMFAINARISSMTLRHCPGGQLSSSPPSFVRAKAAPRKAI